MKQKPGRLGYPLRVEADTPRTQCGCLYVFYEPLASRNSAPVCSRNTSKVPYEGQP